VGSTIGQSEANPGEEAEVSLVELPWIRVQFEMWQSVEGVWFYSLDHDGLFISPVQENSLSSVLPQSIVLENQFQERFLHVPFPPTLWPTIRGERIIFTFFKKLSAISYCLLYRQTIAR